MIKGGGQSVFKRKITDSKHQLIWGGGGGCGGQGLEYWGGGARGQIPSRHMTSY